MTKCERCRLDPQGEYDLHDYCAACSKNLCAPCMVAGRCGTSADHKHHAANHGCDCGPLHGDKS